MASRAGIRRLPPVGTLGSQCAGLTVNESALGKDKDTTAELYRP